MCKLAGLTIFFCFCIYGTKANYLEAESNFQKPKLERNNIINKGLWVRKNNDVKTGDFIFKTNNFDVENVVRTNNDAFSDDETQTFPFFRSYIERSKRSTSDEEKAEANKSMTDCTEKNGCTQGSEKLIHTNAKFLSTLKPASVFNDYPYEVAVLLGNNKQNVILPNLNRNTYDYKTQENSNTKVAFLEKSSVVSEDIHDGDQNSLNVIPVVKLRLSNLNETDNINSTDKIVSTKRSMLNNDFKTQSINMKNADYSKPLNRKNISNYKMDMNIFGEDEMVWRMPAENVNKYKLLPNIQPNRKSEPISEKSLVKILSMLTKTFKKILKQHNDIKNIQSKLHNLNNNFVKKLDIFTNKFEDFNAKFATILDISDKITKIEKNLNEKEAYFESKEKEMTKNFNEFEAQQKKFLVQQRQFYNIQKIMLAQNEKINSKQIDIVKAQNRISYKQHYLARLLKRTKFVNTEKPQNPYKLNAGISKSNINNNDRENKNVTTFITTTVPDTTETVKINLFSIQPLRKIVNHDKSILLEKDYKPVDDLVYKYYFNNTFIDDIIKKKILSSFYAGHEHTARHNVKNKRNEVMKTTILLPINPAVSQGNLREKRWIKNSKKFHKNEKVSMVVNKKEKEPKKDPFFKMASNFCNEIGQNANIQMFKWCVEKAIRKLEIIDLSIPPSLIAPKKQSPLTNILKKINSTVSPMQKVTEASTTTAPVQTTTTDESTIKTLNPMFFPDNDALETNLKQYDMKVDTEGTVYYDGSLHTSDVLPNIDEPDSEGFSDIMPGLDSNSRVQVEPLALDLQAERRANVRRINQLMRLRMG